MEEEAVLMIENGTELQNLPHVDPATCNTDVAIGEEHKQHCENDDKHNRGPCIRCVENFETARRDCYVRYKLFILYGIKAVMLVLYAAYFGYCMSYKFGDEGSIALLIGTVALLIYVSYKLLRYGGLKCSVPRRFTRCCTPRERKKFHLYLRYLLYVVAIATVCLFLGLDVVRNNPENCQSIIGIPVLILTTFIFSSRPSKINWHPVFWGFILQFVFAIVTLRTETGHKAFKWCGDLVQTFVEYSDTGSAFVLGKDFQTMGLAFSASGVVIFFNAIVFLLNYWSVLDVIICKVGLFLSLCLDIGPVESVNAVANIFMALNTAPLLIRPYLPTLTRSELCSVMTCGFASVSAALMGIFILFGAPSTHLLTAAVISAPAALAFTKLVYPETESVNYTHQANLKIGDTSTKGRNALSACADGAVMALKIIAATWANMLAFVSIISMINGVLNWFGQRAGVSGLTFELICSYVLYPLSYVMGVKPEDCGRVASLIGIKMFATPVVGYAELGKFIKNRQALETYVATSNGTWHWSGNNIVLDVVNTTLINGVISERSEAIATYALCGLSAFPAIGITLGTLIPMCPSRKDDIVQLVLTAYFAGNMACFATAIVAGLMYS